MKSMLQGLHGILGQDMIKFLDDLYDGTDSYTDRWLSSGTFYFRMMLMLSDSSLNYSLV